MSDIKILLLADDDQFNELAHGIFKGLPLHLFHAVTLESALMTAKRERPELILLSLDLPGLEPLGACSAFKQDDELRGIPLVVLAASNLDEELLRHMGCDDFLATPTDRNKLFACLHTHISGLDLQNERVPYYSQVTIRDDEDLFYGMSGDISGGGLFVATLDKLPEAAEIRLSFSLPGDKPSLVETKGRVVWLNSKKHPVSTLPEGFGVEFTSISREEYLSIKEFIAAARKKSPKLGLGQIQDDQEVATFSSVC